MSLKITFITKEDYKGLAPEPQPASSLFPEWFSKLEKPSKSKCPFSFVHKEDPYQLVGQTSDNNVKNCPGILDYLTTGYIIPSWDNFIFREDDQNLFLNWSSTWFQNSLAAHGLDQFNTMNQRQKPLYDHFFKLVSPWMIKTEPGVSCLVTHPYWHRKTNFTTASGIYHSDSQEMEVNWFFEWNYKIESGLELDSADIDNQTICKGDPLILIIPFYRKQYEKKVEYLSECEYNRTKNKLPGINNPFRYNDPYRNFRKRLSKFFR